MSVGVERAGETRSLDARIAALVGMALDAATTLEQILECARAARALGDPSLLERVAARITSEVEALEAGSGAWEAELTYSKIEAWHQTGSKVALVAEAWGLVRPGPGG